MWKDGDPYGEDISPISSPNKSKSKSKSKTRAGARATPPPEKAKKGDAKPVIELLESRYKLPSDLTLRGIKFCETARKPEHLLKAVEMCLASPRRKANWPPEPGEVEPILAEMRRR